MVLEDSIVQHDFECSQTDQKKTIKAESPFDKHFTNIRERFFDIIFSWAEEADITLPNSAFFYFLHQEYLPYVGLWGSFTLRDMPFAQPTTHITNGTVEISQDFPGQQTHSTG